ncbi:MAG: hypothetical protein ACQEU4_20935 [Bacillota bacterium]
MTGKTEPYATVTVKSKS